MCDLKNPGKGWADLASLGLHRARRRHGRERAQQFSRHRGESLYVVRAFIRQREILASHERLAQKVTQLERKYDVQFKALFGALHELMTQRSTPKRPIGFETT